MILKKIYSPKLIHSKIVAIQPQLSLVESLRSNYRKNTSDFFGNAPENIVISDRVLDSISFENKDRVICALNYLMYRLGWQKGPIPKEYHSLFIKMIQIVGHVIPGLEASSIPPGFKDNLKIGNVLDFTLNVISIMQRKAFSDDIPLLEAYNAEVLKIKESLIEAGHPKALNWFARTDFLFFWCRALIEKTAHPMLQTLKRLPASQYLDGDLDRKKVHKFLSNFWDTLSKFVLFVVFVDDVADDIQDPTLLKPFLDIPGEVNWDGTLDDSSEQHIRDISTTNPGFSGFFRLYVNTWTAGKNKMIFGREGDVLLYLDTNSATLKCKIAPNTATTNSTGGTVAKPITDLTYANGGTGPIDHTIDITNNFPIQKWVYVTIVLDSVGIADFYLDGKLVKSVQSGNISTSTALTSDLIYGKGHDTFISKFERATKVLGPSDVWAKYMKNNSGTSIKNALGNYNVRMSILKDNEIASTITM